jgi:molybdopterin/thiamine biosynthesis adenylyltransferase
MMQSTATTTTDSGSRLSNEEIERYSRQLIMSEFGIDSELTLFFLLFSPIHFFLTFFRWCNFLFFCCCKDQVKLGQRSALVIGCGGLGCPAALYLCASGLGTLGLLDNDTVELSNIHRQIGHEAASVGTSKAQSLANKCKA